MVILERLKSDVEIFDYFKAIYLSPTKKKGTSYQQNTGNHAWNGHLLTDTGLLTTEKRLSSLTNRKSTFGALMELNSIGVYLEAHYSLIIVGYICEIYDGRMTTSDYIHILKTELADTLDYYRLGDGDFIFQRENDPKHTAKITTTYIKEEEAKYPVLSWPSQSPDLNPIEHIWRHLKLKLALYKQRARGVHELWERIKIGWETFDRDVCCRRILRNFNSGNYKNASDAARKLLEDGENISAETVGHFLKESGYVAIQKPKVLPLTKHCMKERYEFARAHLSWTIDDWKKVTFSDETKVNRIGSDGLQWTWTNGDKLKDFQVQHMIKHGGGSLMLWGCLTWYGVGYLSNIKGSINSDFYIGILEDD
ncbi:hypothetical protein G6F37_006338 [Rhizopus arrhizus]|nr:hypothetical protein G6F38_007018 [Rhizopus arrhizus]KAG1157840.1 hypothetical protein G6F37_006338 [Rhizopus arrhizus]